MFTSRKIERIAAMIVSGNKSDYVYDPDHKKKPSGGGWNKTDKGWSKNHGKPKEKTRREQKRETHQGNDVDRELQTAGLRIPDEISQLYHSKSRELDEGIRRRLSGILRRGLLSGSSRLGYVNEVFVNPKSNKNVKFYSNVDGKAFHQCFSASRQFLENGDCVDVHGEDEYAETDNYMSEDGLQGAAVTKDGDLISVFSLSKEPGFLRTISPMVKDKVKTLDCFHSSAQPLADSYKKAFGFQSASVLKYNKDIQIEDKGKEYADYFEKRYASPPVHFMVNPLKLDRAKHPNCYDSDGNVIAVEFEKDDYDAAVGYRTCLIEGADSFAKQHQLDVNQYKPEMREKIKNMSPRSLVTFVKGVLAREKKLGQEQVN